MNIKEGGNTKIFNNQHNTNTNQLEQILTLVLKQDPKKSPVMPAISPFTVGSLGHVKSLRKGGRIVRLWRRLCGRTMGCYLPIGRKYYDVLISDLSISPARRAEDMDTMVNIVLG
jgi:hypothetical protein